MESLCIRNPSLRLRLRHILVGAFRTSTVSTVPTLCVQRNSRKCHSFVSYLRHRDHDKLNGNQHKHGTMINTWSAGSTPQPGYLQSQTRAMDTCIKEITEKARGKSVKASEPLNCMYISVSSNLAGLSAASKMIKETGPWLL